VFEVGGLYYLLRYRGDRRKSHLISTFEYRGPVEHRPGMHLFVSTSLSADNVFLEEGQLSMMKTFDQLKEALDRSKAIAAASRRPKDNPSEKP
jgi:hypothetical protein